MNESNDSRRKVLEGLEECSLEGLFAGAKGYSNTISQSCGDFSVWLCEKAVPYPTIFTFIMGVRTLGDRVEFVIKELERRFNKEVSKRKEAEKRFDDLAKLYNELDVRYNDLDDFNALAVKKISLYEMVFKTLRIDEKKRGRRRKISYLVEMLNSKRPKKKQIDLKAAGLI